MIYIISYKDPHRHIIDIELIIKENNSEIVTLQLPAWRPGRYELQNYSKNMFPVEAYSESGISLGIQKTAREKWEIRTNNESTIRIRYQYYCYQMDAGGCWLDENQLYLNFINCLLYIPGKENVECSVLLKIEDHYKIACGLPLNSKLLKARNFYELVDSPVIASPNLIHKEFQVGSIPFHIWVEGKIETDWNKIIHDFQKFSEENLKIFEEFPEKEYHFLYQLLPYKHYHGVEHRNSTVITLGPADSLNTPQMYEHFVGVSCHELFHAWNALKIRPNEMLPYDFSKENYFRTGYVIEGITTYYGDFLLARSGVYSTEQYFKELSTLFQRHFESFGNHNLSVAESSFDLWVDGYVPGIPNRKVSIYVKGAVAALILDLQIRKVTDNKKSMDDLMQLLWKEFGKKEIGYTEEDYQKAAEKIAGISLENYFNECIYGTTSLEERLDKALATIGCKLETSASSSVAESQFGFRFCMKENKSVIDLIEPGSPADKVLSKDDEIISVNGINITNNLEHFLKDKKKVTIVIRRWGKVVERTLEIDSKTYLKKYKIIKDEKAGEKERKTFEKWIKHPF